MEAPENVIMKADEVDESLPPLPPLPPPSNASSSASKNLSSSPQQLKVLSNLQYNVTGPTSVRPPLVRDRIAPQIHGTWMDFQSSLSDGATEFNPSLSQPSTGLWNLPTTISPDPTDSLSLGQLKKIVQEIPKLESIPYAFTYSDTSSFEDELEELFDYSWDERNSLLKGRTTHCRIWNEYVARGSSNSPEHNQQDWWTSDVSSRRLFLELLASKICYGDDTDKMESLESLIHVALGCWHEIDRLHSFPLDHLSEELAGNGGSDYKDHATHVNFIKQNILLIAQVTDPEAIFSVFRHAYDPLPVPGDDIQGGLQGLDSLPDIYQQRERWLSTVLMYILVDVAQRQQDSQLSKQLRAFLRPIQSRLLDFLTDLIAKSRWDDNDNFPSPKFWLLYWKVILLEFGGLSDIEAIKAQLDGQNSSLDEPPGEPLITASPLDYHVFRQEIMSKYPAYDPPPALFPFDPDNNSFLPPFQDASSKHSVPSASAGAGPASIPGAGTSIMNQPVHIATPAPSPPPSPAGPGGKGLKKQNYQTNQLFPFLYPPLDQSSNDLGGKGTTELQDLFAGRKWDGSDVPASILEAADLFSKRMRATRAMKQLWRERIRFMKHEQGYGDALPQESSQQDKTTLAVGEDNSADDNAKIDDDDNGDDFRVLDEELRKKLGSVEQFYETSLPRLQSLVIVLLKTLVNTITHLITQTDSLEGEPQVNGQGFDFDANGRDGSHSVPEGVNGNVEEPGDASVNDLASTRNQEIVGKAVSAIIILMLKWLKLSHILKFEYFSQLLLDSNYIQLVMKLFTHQELEHAVTYRNERKELNFFAFCAGNSRNAKPSEASQDRKEDDSDDAAPPPISLSRQQNSRSAIRLNAGAGADSLPSAPAPTQPPPRPPAPEVDELGYPISALPAEPITHYSWRTFFTAINHLRILQKTLKSKPHRQLLMVQGKYSNTLKKHLKVPQPDVRLYTLKIIKGQVPYCHRKWRQGNMRTITAIYLHVKPGLRDEWLSGLDVEQEVGEALPAEQALRALTYWYNLSRFPQEMGFGGSDSDDESALGSYPGLSDSQALSNLDLGWGEVIENADLELIKTNTNDNRDGDGDENAPVSQSVIGDSSAPKLFLEQDFFLRELEKMDLGLSLYSAPSSAASSSGMSPPPSASASSPPPSTRMLPMPDILSPTTAAEAARELGGTEFSVDGLEASAATNVESLQTEDIPQSSTPSVQAPSQRADMPPATPWSAVMDNADGSTADETKPNDSDVIIIAKDTVPPGAPRDTAAALEEGALDTSGPGTRNIIHERSQGNVADENNQGDEEEEEDDDGDAAPDADVAAGENMVLAQQAR